MKSKKGGLQPLVSVVSRIVLKWNSLIVTLINGEEVQCLYYTVL